MNAMIPFLMMGCLLYGALRHVPVYDAFIEGAGQGLRVVAQILPCLFASLLTVNLLRESGLMAMLEGMLEAPMQKLGIPAELLPMALFRPISGSAAMAVLQDIYRTLGPDSFPARAASAAVGSSETVFYTLAVYLGAIGVKKSRMVVPVALASGFCGLLAACFFTRIF